MPNNKNPFLMPPTADAPLDEIERALRRGNKIHAIKIFRDFYGTDLATAKETIESLQNGETINISGKAFKIENLPKQSWFWKNDHGFSKPVETSLKIILTFVWVICLFILLYMCFALLPFSFDF